MHELRDRLINFYFHIGLTYKAIVFALSVQHGIILSVRHLIRILHSRNLTRRKNQTDFNIVVDFIMEEQRQSGIMHGYRWMHQKCKERGIRVWKEDVRLLMSLLDPESVALRRRHRLFRRMYHARGPNYLWHLDSYDKLRPYGICINGCIDGFSRKMIWLNAYFTSSDPKIIGGYFLEVVKEFGGCPRIVRGDCGTENTHVCEFQRLFRREGNDAFQGERSFMYGRSTSNQRIESWWSFLRKECTEFWLAFFDQLKADGYFDGGFLDKNIIQFCFLHIIQVINYYNIRAAT